MTTAYAKRVLIRKGDSVSIHHHLDAKDILAADPSASIHDGLTTINSNGKHITVPAAVAVERCDSAATSDKLVSEPPPEE